MRILFMGTPEFAVPSLEGLWEAGHTICGVFTQPDKPKNRGMKLTASPVKEYALSKDLPVFQPATLRSGEVLDQIRALAPQLIVVAAYGKLLPDEVLALPALGCINVHSSLLPKYRGAAPINWAILRGERETGVTIMHMAHDLDAGDIILAEATAIGENETAPALYDRLARMGRGLLLEAVTLLERGEAPRTPQDPEKVTLAPMLSRELSPMDLTRPAGALHDQVRGLLPWPAATLELGGVRCKVLASAVTGETTDKAPGTVVQADKNGLKLACGAGSVLALLRLQPDGKKPMDATAFLQGHPLKAE